MVITKGTVSEGEEVISSGVHEYLGKTMDNSESACITHSESAYCNKILQPNRLLLCFCCCFSIWVFVEYTV